MDTPQKIANDFNEKLKEAMPVGDMEYFKQRIDELKSQGKKDAWIMLHNPNTGSRLEYDLLEHKPIMYHPYIKVIFTKAINE